MPGMPSTPSAVESGASAGSSFNRPAPCDRAVELPAIAAHAYSPSRKPGWRERHDLADDAALDDPPISTGLA